MWKKIRTQKNWRIGTYVEEERANGLELHKEKKRKQSHRKKLSEDRGDMETKGHIVLRRTARQVMMKRKGST